MTVLRDYADVIARAGAQAVRMVATSATRDADNAAEFVRLVKEVLGVAPEVLTGDEEAVLSFTGATAELAAGPDPGPFLVADIGGGSTEFVLGPAGGPPQHGVSVNIGCVRMTERHLHGDPPAGQEVAAAVADIDAALDTVAAAVPARDARTLIGLAGSVTLKGDEPPPVRVTLGKSASLRGRAVDEAGEPLASTDLSIDFDRRSASELYRFHNLEQPKLVTDNDGRFSVAKILPGERFSLVLTNPPFGGEEEAGIGQTDEGGDAVQHRPAATVGVHDRCAERCGRATRRR
jgi:hypothetical protein